MSSEVILASNILLDSKPLVWTWARLSKSHLSLGTSLNNSLTMRKAVQRKKKILMLPKDTLKCRPGSNFAKERSTKLRGSGTGNLKRMKNKQNNLKTQTQMRLRTILRAKVESLAKVVFQTLQDMEVLSTSLLSKTQILLQLNWVPSLVRRTIWLLSQPSATTSFGLPLRCMTSMSYWKKTNEDYQPCHSFIDVTGLFASQFTPNCGSSHLLVVPLASNSSSYPELLFWKET